MRKDRIKQRREELKLTQPELGRMVGVTKGAVSQWENKNSEVSGGNLLKLAKALKVTPEWIETGRTPVVNYGKSSPYQAGDGTAPSANLDQLIPVFDRGNLTVHLKGGEATFTKAPPERPGLYSGTMFGLIEDMEGMAPLIVKGEVIYIEPNSKPEDGKDCMFWVNETPLVGCLKLTATGMLLRFISNDEGWGATPVKKEDFIGRVSHIAHTRYY